jgi:spermidine synthase
VKKVIYEKTTRFSKYKVVEQIYNNRLTRLLISGDGAPQSGLALDDNPELIFDYNQRFLEVTLGVEPRSVLVIGGGAFTFPKALTDRFPDTSIDVVEIDDALVDIARTHFGTADIDNLSLIIADGSKYIERCNKVYDLIILDAFHEYDIPKSLITREAISHFARLTSTRGSFVMNLISVFYAGTDSLARKLIRDSSDYFELVKLFPTDPHYPLRAEQNYMLVASHDSNINLDYVQSFPVSDAIASNPS